MTRSRGLASAVRFGLGLVAAAMLVSCALFVSFDEYQPLDSSTPFYAVGGSVSGSSTGGSVTLTLNGADPANGLVVTRDGPFVLPTLLATGQTYEVKTFAAGPQTCTVTRGTGTVATADVTDVAVRCASDDAALTSLEISSGELAPAFDPTLDPATHPYTALVSVLGSVTPRVTATARAAGAKIRINQIDVPSGTPSPPIHVVPGTTVIDVEVTAPDSAVTATPTVRHTSVAVAAYPEGYVKASNTMAGAYFGTVAIAGDTLAVGALGEASAATGIGGNQADTSAPAAGAVYVFQRTAGRWAQQAYLKATNTRGAADFGAALALSGDTLAVGSYLEKGGAVGIDGDQASTAAENAGAVYVFTRSGTVWTQQAYIKASNTRPGAYFGASVALSGDTLVAGSPFESSNAVGVDSAAASDTSMPGAGAAYVFVRSGGRWAQQAYVKASNTRASAYFGAALAVSGDTLVIGSYQESSAARGVDGDEADTTAPGAGAAYVFARSGNAWTQQSYLKASNTRAGAEFGCSLALYGDTLAAGACYESSQAVGVGGDQADASASKAGAAYVFRRSATTWSQEAYVKPSNTRAGARFGAALALLGDTLVVGANMESSAATGIDGDPADFRAPGAGAAYVFTRALTTWSQASYLKASNARSNGFFGSAVALSADTLAVGASGDASSATGLDGDQASTTAPNAGAVYLVR